LADTHIGTMFAVGAIGAIIAPFVAGQIADRWFATEKYLGISHVIGGVLVWQLANVEGYWQFLVFSLLYSLVYSPTLPLTNSLAFHHMPDRDRDFGKVRVWGTVGWIAVGIGMGQWLLYTCTPGASEATASAAAAGGGVTPEQIVARAQQAGMGDAFRLSGVLGVLMGLYCFTLPHTPPSRGTQAYATFEALAEIVRKRRLLVLFLLAVPISCIHQFYFVHASGFAGGYQAAAQGLAERINRVFGVGGGGLMTIGQMTEIAVLALIPLVAKTLSRKSLLAIGIVAYTLRMALFAYADPIASATGVPPVAVVTAGIALHGFCFGCFIFVSFMVVDEETTPDVRASAQSLYNLVIIGIGIIVGSMVATEVSDWAKAGGTMNYTRLFSIPMWAALACLVALLAFYPGGRRTLGPQS
jgi:MFS family permease